MASSVEALSPSSQTNVESNISMATCSSPMFSPSSDKRFWSTLRGRVDSLLENRSTEFTDQPISSDNHGAKRLKEDTMLLLRGFDSVAYSLSQLTSNLDNALQGTRDLAKAPTLTDIFHSMSNMNKNADDDCKAEASEQAELEDEVADGKKGVKRKLGDAHEERGEKASSTTGSDGEEELNKKMKKNSVDEKLNKAKNLAVSMATKTASLARELKSIKGDLCFAKERCALLEEENRRLRDGVGKGIRPEEDDLVMMQLEALLAEKSRLANENTNLTRENQCLRQLVEYHQLANQDISASYEQVIQGICLDFSEEEEEEDAQVQEPAKEIITDGPPTKNDFDSEFCTSLDHILSRDEEELLQPAAP